MFNPWNKIDLEIYEQHMADHEVYQLQVLNQITKEQLADNDCTYVGICGVAGGNGLENINITDTNRIFAMDINANYLNTCRKRYPHLESRLALIHCDLLSGEFTLPATTLLICNLIIEYLGEVPFLDMLNRNKAKIGVVSCVIQKNNRNSFVSASTFASHFDPLQPIHNIINEDRLKSIFNAHGFTPIKQKNYDLPNGKELVRMDFDCSRK